MPTIMTVDDEPNLQELLHDLLALEGYAVEQAMDGEAALDGVRRQPPDLMLLDLRMPGMQGLEVLRALRSEGHGFPVVIITAHGDVDTAVDALKAGAADFIVKPFDNDRLKASIRQALEAEGVVEQAGMSRPMAVGKGREMVGSSKGMGAVLELIEKIADTELTALILGESGAGKELVARAIHLKSGRRNAPMISLNCAALPETLLESELFGYERGAFTGAHKNKPGKIKLADSGTLFLDEIGDLSLSAQAKLLRFLEEREFTPLGSSATVKVDVRVIAATNQDLEAMIKTGAFRDDLFFRLNVAPVFLPPLRDRKDDVPELAQYFLAKYRKRHGKPELEIDENGLARLAAHDWPGNIRELEHAIEKFVVLGELPLPANTPPSIPETPSREPAPAITAGPLKERIKATERELIIAALREAGGNKTAAAKLLDVSYKTLFNKIHEHGIEFKTEFE